MDLKRYLIARQKEVDRALDRFLPKASVPPATIHKAMRYSLFAAARQTSAADPLPRRGGSVRRQNQRGLAPRLRR